MIDELDESDAFKRGKHNVCKKRLEMAGFNKLEQEVACAALLNITKDGEEESDRSEFNLMFVDSKECISRKIKIFAHEHGPDSTDPWSHDKVVAAAHGYCRKKAKHDGIIAQLNLIGGSRSTTGAGYYGISRISNISLEKISSLIKMIKSKKGKKVGHMGLPPFLVALPFKSLNRLQTKLKQVVTEEQKFLTAEQKSQRAQYATTMKKHDAIEIADIIGEEHMDYFLPDEVFIHDGTEIDNANVGLNNIIKAPVIIAQELVQPYFMKNDDGTSRKELHFKPYAELSKAIEELDSLPIIIEHKDSWEEEEIIGYVKQLVADPKIRALRGTAYFYENRLPQILLDSLHNKERVAVSIGFMAELGGSGLWNGLFYDHTQLNIILEHLAICLDTIPRCALDLCGVNVRNEEIPEKSEQNTEFTIINKGNYYYNINNILDIEETRIKSKDSDKEFKSDNMAEDSFADPKSGKISSGAEPKDLETMLDRLRKYMAGESDLLKKDFAKKKIQEILHMTDAEGEAKTSTQKGEDMEQKEFEDVIAKKDEEIAELEEIVKESLIKEIKSFTDSQTHEKLKLADKCVHDLKVIRDTVTTYEPIKAEPEVLPVESKSEKKEAMEDAGASPSKKKYDTSEINAKLNEEFEMTGFRISD